jgi:putative addiction module antidote
MNMAIETKVRKIGNSLGVLLPKEAVQTLRVKEGDTLYLTEAPNSSLGITPERPGFKDIMALAEDGMNRYRNALRELAK